MTEPRRISLLAQPWVQSLAIALLAFLAFGSSLDGQLVWDDPLVIGPAASLRSPLDAFRTDLFATGAGAGAVYYRPLVTLSYWIDVRLFTTAPHVGMHLVNLVWHAAAGVLVLTTLRRWCSAGDRPLSALACFGATALWTILPQKAENVAWISGRGDVLGLVFILGSLAFAARCRGRPAALAATAVGTALALLCKESMVAAVAFAAADGLRREHAGRSAVEHLREVARHPPLLAAAAIVATYLALRAWLLPISSGGDGMLAPVERVDKLRLFLETTGVAVGRLARPWVASLLPSPIAFESPSSLVAAPGLAVLGAAAWLAAALLFARAPRARAPLALGFGAFLPVSNLLPTALEARFADRFLYAPSVGLALGIALLVGTTAPPRWGGRAAIALLAIVVPLGVVASARAARFTSDRVLFAWEVEHGDRALGVINNAAIAALDAERYREARDLRLLETRRFHELGFTGEGFAQLYEALRAQTLATEESHAPSLAAFEELSRALLEGRGGTVVAPLEGGAEIRIDAGHQAAREFTARWRPMLQVNLALLLARRGDVAPALDLARAAVEACPRCTGLLLTATRTALAAAQPDVGDGWLARVEPWERAREPLVAAAEVQRQLLEGGDPRRHGLALFVGGAWRPACRAGVERGGGDPATAELLSAACVLGRDAPSAATVAGGRPLPDAALLEPLRTDILERSRLAARAAGAR